MSKEHPHHRWFAITVFFLILQVPIGETFGLDSLRRGLPITLELR
jgi:hypothetical protein